MHSRGSADMPPKNAMHQRKSARVLMFSYQEFKRSKQLTQRRRRHCRSNRHPRRTFRTRGLSGRKRNADPRSISSAALYVGITTEIMIPANTPCIVAPWPVLISSLQSHSMRYLPVIQGKNLLQIGIMINSNNTIRKKIKTDAKYETRILMQVYKK